MRGSETALDADLRQIRMKEIYIAAERFERDNEIGFPSFIDQLKPYLPDHDLRFYEIKYIQLWDQSKQAMCVETVADLNGLYAVLFSDGSVGFSNRNGPEPVKELITHLRSTNSKLRRKAAEQIEFLGPKAKEALPTLIDGLSMDDDYWDYQPSCWAGRGRADYAALAAIGSAAVPELIKALSKDNTNARRVSAYVLGKFGKNARNAVAPLARLLTNDREVEVRQQAAISLGQIGVADRVATAALVKALEDSDPGVRRGAAGALGAADPKMAIPALVTVIDDPDEYVRLQAADSIGFFGSSAVPAVTALANRMLEEKDSGIRRHIADTLRAIGPSARKAAPALVEAMTRQNESEFFELVSIAAALAVLDPENKAGIEILMKAATGDYGHYTLIAAEALLKVDTSRTQLAIQAFEKVVISTLYTEGRICAAIKLAELHVPSQPALEFLESNRHINGREKAMQSIKDAIRRDGEFQQKNAHDKK